MSDPLLANVTTNGLLERVLMAEGRILDHGRAVRVFTDAQRRAILARDQGCRVEGCDAGPERCDIHHVNPFETGGRTDIANAVAKCHHEHLTHHREHWRDRLEPDGTYTVTSPSGITQTSRPPGWQPDQAQLPVHTTSEPAPIMPFTSGDDDDGLGDWEPELSDDDIAYLDEQRRLRDAQFDDLCRRYRALPPHPTTHPKGVGLIDLILNHRN